VQSVVTVASNYSRIQDADRFNQPQTLP